MVILMFNGFILGIASAFHCMVMCGPIALALPLNRKNTTTIFQGIAVNQLGRILTYTILGRTLGFFGFQLPLFHGFQIATVLTGIAFLIVIWKPRWLKKLECQPDFLNRFRQQKMGQLLQQKSQFNLFFIGILNGLLPCALILVALSISLTLGSPENGIIFMLGYGLGTIPGITIVAFLGARMFQQIPFKVRKSAPITFSFIAMMMILRGLNLGIPYLSPKVESVQKQIVESGEMPHQVICK